MPFTEAADGARIYYETHGTGEDLLLISGQAGDHHGWDAIREDFTGRYRVTVYDHRGTGRSDKPEAPPYTTRGFAADAVAVLDAAGADRAHVYGTSMGGRIAQWLGIDHRDRLRSLVLGCTTPGDAHGIPRDARATLTMLDRTDARAGLLQSYTPEYVDAHPELLTTPPPPPIPDHARILHFQASQSHDTWELLPGITTPTLVIHGSDDVVNPTPNAELLARRIPGAKLHIVHGGRHTYYVEFREESSRVVLDFLESQSE
ncbi:MAG TPA: alpha/beta fold hydrolase [Mycobacteriales bacterium]|nr:alpha/beta fold hydrolase [Mycobacteriales bacterium]